MKKQFLVVTVPVANLRKEPVEGSCKYICDDLQKTQLLYNECLLYKEENEDWYYVEAVEQKKTTPQGDWQGYPGWIQKTSATFIDTWPAFNAVVRLPQAIILRDFRKKTVVLFAISVGTRLAVEDMGDGDYYKTILIDGQQGWIKKEDVNITTPVMDTRCLRNNIMETTKLFLGMPYLWGGRSACAPNGTAQRAWSKEQKETPACDLSPPTSNLQPIATGVDCSSLTNLACRVNWLDIPRDAHDQWSASTEIGHDMLQSADLIFVSAEEPHEKITHVMIHLSGEEFIEALETGSVVMINTFKNKFGVTLHEAARQGFIVNKRKMHFGSILIAGKKK